MEKFSAAIKYEVQDLIDAQNLFSERYFNGYKMFRTGLMVLVAVFMVCSLIELMSRSMEKSAAFYVIINVCIGVLATVAFYFSTMLVVYTNIPQKQKRAFEQVKDYEDEITFTIEGEELNIRTNVMYGSIEFANLFKWLENDKTIIVMQREDIMNFFPKAKITPEFLGALHTALAHHKIPKADFKNS